MADKITSLRWISLSVFILCCVGLKTDFADPEGEKEWVDGASDGDEHYSDTTTESQSSDSNSRKMDSTKEELSHNPDAKESTPEALFDNRQESVNDDTSSAEDFGEKGAAAGRSHANNPVKGPVEVTSKKPRPESSTQDSASSVPDLVLKDSPVEEGDELYFEAEKLLSPKQIDSERQRGLGLLQEAVKAGNTKAKRKLAYYRVLGLAGVVEVNFTRSLELFSELAAIGNPAGQHGLGLMYSLGLGVNASQAKAQLYYTFGALGGDLLSQMTMAYRYLSGINVDQSCESALVYYTRVAEAVVNDLQFIVTAPFPKPRVFEEEDNPDEEKVDDDQRHFYEMLADKGELHAQVMLSQMFMSGLHGTERDLSKALHYLNQAAGEGHAIAYANIGKIYLQGGSGVAVDHKKALEYFTKAANLKEGTGLAGLGIMYFKGLAVEKDVAKAFTYFTQSAQRGSLDGHVYLGEMFLRGIGTKANYQVAQQHLQLGAQHDHLLAIYYMGYMLTHGLGVVRSCPLAVNNIKEVADNGEWSEMFVDAKQAFESNDFESALLRYLLLGELGYETAQSNAAYILETYSLHLSSTEEDNARRALMMWKRAASQGYATARLKVGDYYYYGWGTGVDYDAAVNQYQIASDRMLPQALFNLGYMHEYGLGLKRDYHLAKRYYDNAAEVSEEANVPVTLALIKLNYNFFFENFAMDTVSNVPLDWLNILISRMGKNWDMYAVTALGLLVGLIYLIRQHR